MKKIKKIVPVKVEKMEEKEFFVTSDGIEFEQESDAIFHESLFNLQEINLDGLLPNFGQVVRLVRFENERQVEFYERKQCGNQDNNTWGSWVSCKEKFENLPKWIVCCYQYHDYSDDYIAIYYTLDEFKENLKTLTNIVDHLY